MNSEMNELIKIVNTILKKVIEKCIFSVYE